jgi:hypothetical protein
MTVQNVRFHIIHQQFHPIIVHQGVEWSVSNHLGETLIRIFCIL